MLAEKTKAYLPPAPKFRKILGPSFILLGLGLGSGELILWPYLSATHGLGIIWGAVIGITLQFFINMEIERYTLATGESVFVGLARKIGRFSPVWFILSTIIPWMWPGIISMASLVLSPIVGVTDYRLIAIPLLLAIGLILSLGPYIYKTQEVFQKTLIFLSVPFFIVLVFLVVRQEHWQSLGLGLIGIGDGYWLLPTGLSLLTFLGALAYSGAGGNLNLAQSFYVKEKGFGMSEHSGKISSLLYKKSEKITLEGFSFEKTPENLQRFRSWWKIINQEHLIVFWGTGLVTMLSLAILSFSLNQSGQPIPSGTAFLFFESQQLAERTVTFLAPIFLIVVGLTLFSTQFSILDATSRIISENLVIINKNRFSIINLPKFYFFFLWLQIFLQIGIVLLGVAEPFTLVIIGAVLNAFSMFVYSGLILWLNTTALEKELRPVLWRKIAVLFAFLFFGLFSFVTIIKQFFP